VFSSQFRNGFVRRFADQCSEFQIFAAFFDSISDPMSLVAFDNQVFNKATDHRSTGVIAAPFVALVGFPQNFLHNSKAAFDRVFMDLAKMLG